MSRLHIHDRRERALVDGGGRPVRHGGRDRAAVPAPPPARAAAPDSAPASRADRRPADGAARDCRRGRLRAGRADRSGRRELECRSGARHHGGHERGNARRRVAGARRRRPRALRAPPRRAPLAADPLRSRDQLRAGRAQQPARRGIGRGLDRRLPQRRRRPAAGRRARLRHACAYDRQRTASRRGGVRQARGACRRADPGRSRRRRTSAPRARPPRRTRSVHLSSAFTSAAGARSNNGNRIGSPPSPGAWRPRPARRSCSPDRPRIGRSWTR